MGFWLFCVPPPKPFLPPLWLVFPWLSFRLPVWVCLLAVELSGKTFYLCKEARPVLVSPATLLLGSLAFLLDPFASFRLDRLDPSTLLVGALAFSLGSLALLS